MWPCIILKLAGPQTSPRSGGSRYKIGATPKKCERIVFCRLFNLMGLHGPSVKLLEVTPLERGSGAAGQRGGTVRVPLGLGSQI